MRHHNDERICTVYFENAQGYVIIAPDQSHPTPQGFERREAKTLREIDRLTERMNRQDRDMFSRMMEKDKQQMLVKHDQIRAKLRQRLLAVDCSRPERLFILGAMDYLRRKEEEITKFSYRGYFQQREFDSKRACTENYGKQITMPKMSERLASALSH